MNAQGRLLIDVPLRAPRELRYASEGLQASGKLREIEWSTQGFAIEGDANEATVRGLKLTASGQVPAPPPVNIGRGPRPRRRADADGRDEHRRRDPNRGQAQGRREPPADSATGPPQPPSRRPSSTAATAAARLAGRHAPQTPSGTARCEHEAPGPPRAAW